MTVKLTGLLTDVFPPETTPSFSKRVFWLKEPDTERYPQHWQIELHQDDGKRITDFEIGDRLECEVEIRGKKYTNRSRSESIFISLKCVGIKLLGRIDPKETAAKLGKFTPKKTIEIDENDVQGKLPLS